MSHSRDLKCPLYSSVFWVPALSSLRTGGGGGVGEEDRRYGTQEREHRLPEISQPKQNIRTNGVEIAQVWNSETREGEAVSGPRCLQADAEYSATPKRNAPKLRAQARGSPREQDGRETTGGGPWTQVLARGAPLPGHRASSPCRLPQRPLSHRVSVGAGAGRGLF